MKLKPVFEKTITSAVLVNIIALILFSSAMARAEIRVAFIQIKNPDGKPIQLEPGDRFAHLGIAYNHGWIHVHPYRGVEWVPDLKIMGEVKEILVASWLPDLTPAQVEPWLGMPYDHSFNWANTHGTYCSKLIAQLLNIPPEPMTFTSDYWKNFPPPPGGYPEGAPGISPDKVYRALKVRNYAPVIPHERIPVRNVDGNCDSLLG